MTVALQISRDENWCSIEAEAPIVGSGTRCGVVELILMTKLSIGIVILFFVSGTAFAAGVNDVLPNGQQGYYPRTQPLNPNANPATPNRYGDYYYQRPIFPMPRVKGAPVRTYRR